MIVKTENLHYDYFRYDDDSKEPEVTHALKGIDLEIEEGSFIAVVGRNGCGKSTLAKHINALLAPTEGNVWVCGMDTRDESLVWEIRRNAGMVFQNPDNQIIASVVEEDVAFGPENLSLSTEEIWERVDKALADTHMTAFREWSPNKLSGGQKQRLAIAGVLAMEPSCIILDEPTAMLDPLGRAEVIRAVKELNDRRKVTVILVTHFMEEAAYADRILVMSDGRIAMDGTPREIFADPNRIEELGLKAPAATLLAEELVAYGMDIERPVLTMDELVEQICRSN